ncbi:MAG TPA: LysM peptidoglycan-binding domain-containing protein [Gammaproteobacteria bacterium]|nr:LysM peptidoglycan-binding domain-containing protein [Gammaproteobacteria bacterium]
MPDKNNNGPCRATRLPQTACVLALGALLSACQSFGPSAAVAPAQPLVVAPTAADPLEPIVLPQLAYRAPVAEADLLARLRLGLDWEVPDDATVEREQQWYARNQAYLNRVFARSELYLFHIVAELEARQMPAELALLPIVESAFDPFAYSHGRASGLWQIIPGTGRRLGLTQNWWFDGRRDVLDSTRAALDYLEQLHAQFDGDWLLAVAGYNSGEGNVARARKKAAAAGRPQDFWGIKSYLPAETRTYVPRLLAIVGLVGDPEAFGVTLPAIANEPKFAVVETGGQIDMTLAASLAGLETDALYALNAGINHWATDPDGPHRLVVPVAQAESFKASLAALGEDERVQWTRHRIKTGETIGGIAERYATTPAVLRELNGLRGNTIRAGDYLLIPTAVASRASYTQSADARAERRQSTPQNGERRAHVVRSGESLWSIARDYGVALRSLASWNAMAPGDVLSVGRELVVWTQAPAQIAAAATSAASLTRSDTALGLAATGRIREITYVVRRGDSLSSIARRFRVTVDKLVEWNRGAGAKYLQPGQRLKMLVDVTAQSG